MADLRIVDAPEIPTNSITGGEKIPTGGNGNYSISLNSVANYTKTKKDLADNNSVDNKVNGVRQELNAHTQNLSNPHQVTKGQIGLGNVNNTADMDKPVSNSTKSAIISAVTPKSDKTYVDNQLALKSDKTYVDGQLTLKADKTYVDNQLALKSDKTYVDNQLALKANNDDVKRGIANRYDSSLTYNSGERVVLTNGDIVKSTINGNANNPNLNMTGWVKEPNANSIFRINGKALGLVPFVDISSALSSFLNSNDVKEIYLDGEYILQNKIVVSTGVSPKKIFCSDSTILKPTYSGALPLFDLYSSVEFHNATFDYQNGNCFTTLRYRPSCGLVKLRDVKIKNIKDMINSYGTIIFSISTEGNKLDIDGISFENCLKLGNGTITDSAGSLNGVYYFGTTGLIRGEIKNIYAKNFHNIDASSKIMFEDTAVVYIATGGVYAQLTVENVIGDEFGKRLVKAQCSGVTFKNIRGTSTTGDSLSVIGILSDVGFTAVGNIVSGVYARGNMDYAYTDSGVDTKADNLDIDLYGDTTLTGGPFHFGAYYAPAARRCRLQNAKIKSRRPIGINPTTDIIEDLNFDDVDLELTDVGNVFIDIPGNASITNGAIKRLTAKLTLRTSATRTVAPMMINTFAADKGYSDFNFDVEFIDNSSASNTTQATLGNMLYIKNLNVKAKFISASGLAPSQTGDLATINNSSNVFIHVDSEQKFNRGIIAVANTGFKVSKEFRLGSCAIGQVVATGVGTKYDVPDHISLFNSLTSVNEVLRGFGTTTQRPANATIGFRYFDTTLNKPIFLKTQSPNVWVDSTGTTV